MLKLAKSKTGRRATGKLGVDWRQVLPEAEVAACGLRQVEQLRRKRLAQWHTKLVRAP